MKRLFLSGAIILFIAIVITNPALGWQSTWPADYRAKVTTRVYEASYEQVFDAVIKFCAKSGYPIVIQNRNNGVVVTDNIPSEDLWPGKGEVGLDFLISRGGENSTSVHLDIKFALTSGYGTMEDAAGQIDEDDYKDYFDKIDQILKNPA